MLNNNEEQRQMPKTLFICKFKETKQQNKYKYLNSYKGTDVPSSRSKVESGETD